MTDFRTRFPRAAAPRVNIAPDVLALCRIYAQRAGISLDLYISEALRRDLARLQCLASELPLASLASRDMIERISEAAKEEAAAAQEEAAETHEPCPRCGVVILVGARHFRTFNGQQVPCEEEHQEPAEPVARCASCDMRRDTHELEGVEHAFVEPTAEARP